METVATGTPAGICTIDSNESMPSSRASGTGTPITGNGVAAVFVSWWEGELDREKLHANLDRTFDPSDVEAAVTTG